MVPQAGLFGLGPWELVIILVVVLVLFGGTKLAGLGKASGQAIREFKEEIAASKDDAAPAPAGAATPPADTAQTPPSAARH